MPSKKEKEQPKSLRGKQTKAGQLLSQLIRQMALEETELVKGEDCDDAMVTKAEALARYMWKKALGYTEIKVDDDGKTETITHLPDKWAIDRLWDRIEGRVPTTGPEKKEKRSVSDRVSEQNARRLNTVADNSAKKK